jgi:hypothetical protein
MHGRMQNLYKDLVGKPEGRSLHGRPGCRGDDIQKDLKEIGWECVDWIHVAQDSDQWCPVVNTVMNILVP